MLNVLKAAEKIKLVSCSAFSINFAQVHLIFISMLLGLDQRIFKFQEFSWKFDIKYWLLYSINMRMIVKLMYLDLFLLMQIFSSITQEQKEKKEREQRKNKKS